MATLYELTHDLEALYELAQEPDIDEQTLKDTLEGVEGEFEIKAEGYVKVIKELSIESDALKDEIARLQARKKAVDNNITRIKENLCNNMEIAQKPKFRTSLFNIFIKKNQPSLVIDNEEKVPAHYWIPQPPTVDKTALKKALVEAEKLEEGNGTTEYAHLASGRHVEWR